MKEVEAGELNEGDLFFNKSGDALFEVIGKFSTKSNDSKKLWTTTCWIVGKLIAGPSDTPIRSTSCPFRYWGKRVFPFHYTSLVWKL